jgi:3-mercaptopyruvate sulfurtransferase SseA
VARAKFQSLLRRLGVDESTTVVAYGDRDNWWATYVFPVFRLFDFPESRLRLGDGGRAKWVAEERPLVTDVRSSHTWFTLTCLLGYDRVRNYDGSWTEWGNSENFRGLRNRMLRP